MSKVGSVMVVPLGDRTFDRSTSDALRANGWRVLVARNWRWAQEEISKRRDEFDAVLISGADRAQCEAFVAVYEKRSRGNFPPLLVFAVDPSTCFAMARSAAVYAAVASSSSDDVVDSVTKASVVGRAKRRSRAAAVLCECGSRHDSGFHSRWCPAHIE